MSELASMQCPKCEGELDPKAVAEGVAVHQCNKCYGLFVPPGTTQKLFEIWGPDTNVDTGSEKVGRKYDAIDDIECPKCNIKMDKIEDQDQPHIWIENCAMCGSTFYDAGELSDLKEKTISDFFKRFFKGKREA